MMRNVRVSLLALMTASLAFALSTQQILENNLKLANDVNADFAGLEEGAANAAVNLAKANAGLQGVVNALQQEMPELQQRLGNTQDEQTRRILEAKQQILNDLHLDLLAALAADHSFRLEMEHMSFVMYHDRNAATAFGNCVRNLFVPPLPNEPFTLSGIFVDQPVPSIPPPSSADLATYIDENLDLIDAAAGAIGDRKKPKKGDRPDKMDAFNGASKVIEDIKKAKKSEERKLVNEALELIKIINKSESPDPILVAKLRCLVTLIGEIDGIDTSAVESARALDMTAILRAEAGAAQAAADMLIVRLAVH